MFSLSLEQYIEERIKNAINQIRLAPLNLGAVSASGGGAVYSPNGYIGMLPQTRVAFDYTEASTSGIPASGASLLDNLNRIRYRISELESIIGSGVVTTFLNLSDTPSSYAGQAFKVVRVKEDESGLEFAAITSGGASYFTDLLDTPPSYVGFSGYLLRVSGTEDGIEFTQLSPITQSYSFFVDGALDIASDIQSVIVETDITLKEFYVAISSTGSSGDTIVTLSINGTQIASVTIPYNSSDGKGSTNTNVSAQKGDILSISITSVAAGASTLSAAAIYEVGSGVVGGGGGASTFLQLTDTPSSYAGNALKILRVNSSATGIEFADAGGGSNNVTLYVPDSPPLISGSLDDEFNDYFFSDWGIYNHSGNSQNLSILEGERGLTLSLDTDYSYGILGVYKELSGANYPITFFTKVSANTLRDQNLKAGIIILENPTNPSSRVVFVHLNSVGFESYQAIDRFTGYNDGTYVNWIQESIGRVTNGVYLKVTITLTSPDTYYFKAGMSLDGIGWIDFSTTNPLGFLPSAIGLGVWKNSLQTNLHAIFRFFRNKGGDFLVTHLDGRELNL